MGARNFRLEFFLNSSTQKERENLRLNGRDWAAKHLDWDPYISELINILEEVIQENRK